jgi:hypothetical protein
LPRVYLLSGYKVEHDTSLEFEKTGSIEIQFQVAPIGAKGAETGGHMHMQH